MFVVPAGGDLRVGGFGWIAPPTSERSSSRLMRVLSTSEIASSLT